MARVGALAVVLVVVCAACNALSGGDKLSVAPANGDDSLVETAANDAATTPPVATDGPGRERGGSDGGVTGSSDASFDATTNPVAFFDPFTRSNSATVGNGWLEKTAGPFSLSDDSVLQSGTGSYVNFLVRRPATEAVRDVQLAVDFTYGANVDSDPTLYARIQPNSDAPDVLSGYTFYAYTDFAGIDREEGAKSTPLLGNAISPALTVGATYHLVFRVHGTDTVQLEAQISDGAGRVVSMAITDSDPKRVTAAGQIGFGSSKANGGRWDNFARTDL